MTLSCRYLLNKECFGDSFMYLGEKMLNSGLDNRVLWFYIDNTPAEQKMNINTNGNVGELVFVNHTFVEREMGEQLNYLSQCIKKNIAGLVLCDVEKKEIPIRFIRESEDKDFPLFILKKRSIISEITKTIAEMIIQDENKDEYTTVFMNEILSGKLDSSSIVLAKAIECGIDLNMPYIFISLKIDLEMSKSKQSSGRYYLEVMHYILPKLEYLCKNVKILKYFSFERGVGLFNVKDKEQLKEIRTVMDSFLKNYFKETKIVVKLGFSNMYNVPEKLTIAYDESHEAVQAAIKAPMAVVSYSYEDLGILRFLSSLAKNEQQSVIEVANRKMKPLLEYDEINGADLLNTLYEYLRSDGNLIEASHNLYIHRNTLLKRLKKIEDLLDKNIRDFQIKWDIYNSIYVLKYFDAI